MTVLSETLPGGEEIVFRLFVARDETNSRRAEANFKELCESRIDKAFEIEIVDVLQSFKIALENNIYLTPALVKVSPEPRVIIFGDLSDAETVLKALQLGEDE
ncbi:MAG: circadian clock KaiB family protein [Deltaproteobacteria bacterium]|nr:circadian clock KaiB family protein [Deltaproteobacteria bacterium]